MSLFAGAWNCTKNTGRRNGSGWSEWFDYEDQQVALKSEDDSVVHILIASANEPNPRKNHIHVKFNYRSDGSQQGSVSGEVVCAVKVDGDREVNRRELFDTINSATGLNLSYR